MRRAAHLITKAMAGLALIALCLAGGAFVPASAAAIPQLLNVAGDFNADGLTDLARCVDAGGGTFNMWFFMSDGTQFQVKKSSLVAGWGYTLAHWLAGDVDGDGRDELVAFYNYGGTSCAIWVFEVDGTSLSGSRPWYVPSGWEWARVKPFIGDIDGDGRDEILAAYDHGGDSTGIWTWDIDAASVTPRRDWYTASSYNWSNSNYLCGDVDGNGVDEIISYYNYSLGSTGIWLFSRQPDGSIITLGRKWFVSSGWDYNAVKPVAGDVDGDGRDEIALLYNYNGWNGWAIGLWTKDAETNPMTPTQRPWTPPSGSWSWDRVSTVIGDADGDGKDELMGFYDYGSESWGLFCWRPDRDNWWAFKFWNKGAGAWSEAAMPMQTSSFAIVDNLAPTTLISGVAAGWSKTPVTFTLRASDGTGGRGVKAVNYRLNGGAQVLYANPVTVATEGETTVEYWATDVVVPPNTETAKSAVIKVDMTPPVTASDAVPSYQRSASIRLTAADARSGVATTQYRLDGGNWVTGNVVSTDVGGLHTLGLRSTDVAGNVENERTVTFTVEMFPASISFSVTSASPRAGDSVTVSGRLTAANGSALSGVAVKLQRSSDGSVWTDAANATTNASGDFSIAVTPSGATHYRVTSASTATHGSATSPGTLVTPVLRSTTLTLAGPASTPRAVASFTLSGRLTESPSAGVSGAAVKVQRSTDGSTWTDIGTATTNGAGDFTFSASHAAGAFYRALFAATATHAASSANAVRVGVSEPDDEPSGASAPSVFPLSGSIRDGDDVRDVYRITTDGSGHPVDLGLTGPASADFRLAVYSASASSLDGTSALMRSGGTVWPRGVRLPNAAAEELLLVVERHSGSGSYAVARTDHLSPEVESDTASPITVRYGSTTRISASVIERPWMAGSMPVQVRVVAAGKARYYSATALGGVMAFSFKPTARSVVSMRSASSPNSPAGAWSAPVEVRVAHAVSAPTVSAYSVKRMQRIRISGKVVPKHAVGTKVRVEVKNPKGVVKTYTAKVTSTASGSCTWALNGALDLKGTWRFRATLPGDSAHEQGTSGWSRGVVVR
ncbi:MAG: FG-GAP-like repeat-containing protein [Coriobacteriia bacterium]|nr:FG-GAP-like repeat-containing protein [Coriobacteriia bacterium]